MDPYNRVLNAARKTGGGVRLTHEECRALASDGAFEQRAAEIDFDPKQWAHQLEMTKPKARYFGPVF